MYLGAGDSQSGEQRDSRRLNPQRLDTLVGKILRIVPDLREHTTHEHGQRERPLSHPQRQSVRRRSTARARRSGPTACAIRIGWSGSRSGAATAPTLLAFNIGLVTWETVDVIHKGANYGYPLREGTQSMSSTNGMGRCRRTT